MTERKPLAGASFRAAREIAGLTQQTVARRLGVNLQTVKRWERGDIVPSPAARALIDGALRLHDAEVEAFVRKVAEEADGNPVELGYYRTREEYEAVSAEPGLTYTFANAVTRSAAEKLVAMGVPVSFVYPGERGRRPLGGAG